jgi:redox-sensitive bicupin YhaK (pirin superfamily)
MHAIRLSQERGRADLGWLESRHTFSFGDYYDARFMGFGPLRVINEDRVAPGAGFGTHSHRDMEILSWVLSGALEHKDSLGTGAVIRPGELQRMTAGTGVTHSEFNRSRTDPVHFLQIWLLPEKLGLQPGYEQRAFSDAELLNRWRLIAAGDGRDGAVKIHQEADVYAARFDKGTELAHTPATGRRLWLQVAHGALEVAGAVLRDGDGMAWTDAGAITARAQNGGEALLFDMTA